MQFAYIVFLKKLRICLIDYYFNDFTVLLVILQNVKMKVLVHKQESTYTSLEAGVA
jgi:hypothetical protein